MREPTIHLLPFLLISSLLWTSASCHSRKAPFAAQPRNHQSYPLQTTTTTTSTTTPSAENVVTVIEEEEYDESGTWRDSFPSRWRDTEGRVSPAPLDIVLISNENNNTVDWMDDWKIVTSQHRDALGWEYKWRQGTQLPVRRRVWLRAFGTTNNNNNVVVTTTTTTTTKKKKTNNQSTRRRLQKQNFNFKGFGINFYKSCFLKEQVGLALRLPISSNWNWWERHPGLPSFTSTFALYYPWCLMAYISCSINLDYLKWAMRSIIRIVHVAIMMALDILAKVAALPLALLFFPITKSLSILLPTLPIPPLFIPKPQESSQVVQEKVGCSISWRYYPTTARTEFRFSQYYACLPTLVYLVQAQQNLVQQLRRQSKQPLVSFPLLDWLRTKTASLGLSFGRPTSDAPGFTCSAMLSLSGLYLLGRNSNSNSNSPIINTKQQQQQQQQQHMQQSATSSLSSSLTWQQPTTSSLEPNLVQLLQPPPPPPPVEVANQERTSATTEEQHHEEEADGKRMGVTR